MRIGVPKEIKTHENRVGLTPSSVRELTVHGHQVMVQKNAGLAINLDDGRYQAAGAEIVETAEEIFAQAELIVKVKEPQPEELKLLRADQILFTYLHLAPDPAQAEALLESGCIAIAYETVTDQYGGLPLLAPMSEVAGRMSIQAGAHALEMDQGGRGMLLGGVSGVPSAKVVILGGGVVGTNAARVAMGMEAHVTVIDKSIHRLQQLDLQYGSRINTVFSTVDAIEEQVSEADLVVGAVLVPGGSTPKLVSHKLVENMNRGAVLVDVAIDQGGCFATSRPTTLANPIYILDDVVHYCVSNMPGAVARTSTFALNNVTLPYVLSIAEKGGQGALIDDPHLRNGLNVYQGQITHQAVAHDLGLLYVDPQELLR
ncbi:alanine dehydrogenase [Nitrosomonas sp.]|uniref:alanine dehydrogenase n=1 Tax=Nitrosomonas sp. TaxID=42353 RepID=UPI0028463AA8|nr:alanine dehydrogenase [Nitrosomonas sp.]MCP5242919.1 alanine dehydrogenase [Burkholderiales bacterium]MCP5291558.1 alanine dehydrogenase [Burkholderiales bacterium]MDR4515464.1 alanine dehydrogenase [Nitrosomonas sp.]